MTPQELRTRELLTRALPYLGPEGVEAVSAYLVGDRSFRVGSKSWDPDRYPDLHARSLLHWACNRPGCDWERSSQETLNGYLDYVEHASISSLTP